MEEFLEFFITTMLAAIIIGIVIANVLKQAEKDSYYSGRFKK